MVSCVGNSRPALQPLVLASASPRRREILAQLGLAFEVLAGSVEEPAFAGGEPGDYARKLANIKAEAGAASRSHAAVLGADTIVVVDGDVLGKPRDDTHAEHMIARLAGRQHQVITAVAVCGPGLSGELCVVTEVCFRPLSEREVKGYAATGEGRDKAGAYAVQGLGAGLVSRIDGSYSNVVGLPAAETLVLLRELGVLGDWP